MRAHSAEVKSGTKTTISCVITGITSPINVKWLESSGGVIEMDADNYTPNSGTLDNNRQTATLEVKGATEDKTFTCRVIFPGSSSYDTDVQLNVYGGFLGWY